MKFPIKLDYKLGFTFGQPYPTGWGNLTGKPHLGVDIIVPEGTPVHSPETGKIMFIGHNRPAGGNMIYLLSNTGLLHRFLHLSEMKVNRGDVVVEDQIIGLVGSTGLSTGPHLHWDVSRDMLRIKDFANFVDPMKLLGNEMLIIQMFLMGLYKAFGWKWTDAAWNDKRIKSIRKDAEREGRLIGSTKIKLIKKRLSKYIEEF